MLKFVKKMTFKVVCIHIFQIVIQILFNEICSAFLTDKFNLYIALFKKAFLYNRYIYYTYINTFKNDAGQ